MREHREYIRKPGEYTRKQGEYMREQGAYMEEHGEYMKQGEYMRFMSRRFQVGGRSGGWTKKYPQFSVTETSLTVLSSLRIRIFDSPTLIISSHAGITLHEYTRKHVNI